MKRRASLLPGRRLPRKGHTAFGDPLGRGGDQLSEILSFPGGITVPSSPVPPPPQGEGDRGRGDQARERRKSRTSRANHPQRGPDAPAAAERRRPGRPQLSRARPPRGRGGGGTRAEWAGPAAKPRGPRRLPTTTRATATRRRGRPSKPRPKGAICDHGGAAAATHAAAGGPPGRIPNEPRHSPRSAGAHGATATAAAPADLTRGRDGGPRRGLHRCPPGAGGPHRKRSTIFPRMSSTPPSRPAACS